MQATRKLLSKLVGISDLGSTSSGDRPNLPNLDLISREADLFRHSSSPLNMLAWSAGMSRALF